MKLYELTQNYLNVLELAESNDSQAIIDTLESIDEAFDDKAENIAKMVKEIDATSIAIDGEIKRLQERKSTLAGNAKGMKGYLQAEMENLGKTKIKGQLFNIGIQNNPVSMVIASEKNIPEDFYAPQPPKLDKAELKSRLKDGLEVEGVELIQTRGLRIR